MRAGQLFHAAVAHRPRPQRVVASGFTDAVRRQQVAEVLHRVAGTPQQRPHELAALPFRRRTPGRTGVIPERDRRGQFVPDGEERAHQLQLGGSRVVGSNAVGSNVGRPARRAATVTGSAVGAPPPVADHVHDDAQRHAVRREDVAERAAPPGPGGADLPGQPL
jgi:hypothetical protein